ncbi:MAG TPA: hydroxymethylglutaryl-CoA lyase [Chitinophagales bacterium]|nr:hydroxymethylglutaryl-CoA lyase [Chitinophagales bacterium]
MTDETAVKIIECPRDAMQGIRRFIPTQDKVNYVNALLKVGFDTLDIGSFVSPTAIPQMSDTALVLSQCEWHQSNTKLLVISANTRGAREAAMFEQVDFIGYPFSVSPTFQKRNTNATQEEALKTIDEIQNICIRSGKQLVVYLSMGFGNPYGDPWNADVVMQWANEMSRRAIGIQSLADTVGMADVTSISHLFGSMSKEFPRVELGVHLHTAPHNWKEKVEAAWSAGCRRFDGAIKGFGGCPMAADALVGNMPTENLVSFLQERKMEPTLDQNALVEALRLADGVFQSVEAY